MSESLSLKVTAARKRWKRLKFAAGACVLASVVLFTCILSFHVDRLFVLTSAGRLSWLVTLILGFVISSVIFIWRPASAPISDEAVATEVERSFPTLKERLLTTVELAHAGVGSGGSITFITALSRETEALAASLDFTRAIPVGPLLRPATFAGIAGFLLIGHMLFAPEALRMWLNRVMFPFADIPIYAHTHVWVTPDDTVLPRGSDAAISIRVTGRTVESSTLRYRFDGGNWTSAVLTSPKSDPNSKGQSQTFTLKLPDLQQSVSYYAKAGDGQSNAHIIRVEDRPAILSVKLDLQFPAYTGRKPESITASSGNIVAPVGTKVEVTGTANKTLSAATLVENGKSNTDWPVRGEVTGGKMSVFKDENYSINLKDRHGFESQNPPIYTIKAQPDSPPEVQIIAPTGDIDRTPNGSLRLSVNASDDYGISSLRLSHQVGKKDGSLPLPMSPGARSLSSACTWNLGLLNLKPGDTVEYDAVAKDNDSISGPHTGRSGKLKIHILGLTEMRERLEAQMAQEREALKDLIKKQKDAEAQLAQARNQPTRMDKLDAAQSAERSIAQEAHDLVQRMKQTTEQLRDNQLSTSRDQQRREEQQKRLDQLAANDMPAAANKIQQAAQQPVSRPNQLASAAEQEKAIRQELERLSREQDPAPDISQLADEADRLAQGQRKLADLSDMMAAKTDNRPPNALTAAEKARLAELQKAQAKLKEQTKSLQNMVEQAASEAHERGRNTASDLNAAAKQAQQSGITQKQSNAQKSLQQGRAGEATPQQSQAAQDLQQLANALDKAGEKQSAESLQSRAERLDKAADRLMEMAEQQRKIKDEVQRNPNAERTKQLAEREKNLQEQAKQVQSQLKDAPAASQNLSAAQQGLQQSEQQLNQGQPGQASSPAVQAQRELMRAAQEAQNEARRALEQQQAREAQQAVEKLAREQRELMKQTHQVDSSKQNGQLPPEQQKKAQQLANSQQQLFDKTKNTSKDMPSEAFRWAMDEAARKMDNATRGLQQQNSGADTQRNQENAAQTLERVARSLGEQANGEQQQSQSGSQQDGAGQAMAEASGEMQLAREMQAQIRRETASVEQRRSSNPNHNLTAEQQRELSYLQQAERRTREITENAARRLRASPEIAKGVQDAADKMDDVQEMLRQQQTGDPNLKTQDQIVSQLDRAIRQSRQAMRQQQQQQRMAQQGQQQGQQPQQQRMGGNRPSQALTAPIAKTEGEAHGKFDNHGRGFNGLSPRAQQTLREGRTEKVPMEFREVVNQYFRALGERGR